MNTSGWKLLGSVAGAAMLGGCAGAGSGEGISLASINPLSRNVATMERRLVETEAIAVSGSPVPASYGASRGPRTFFYSGRAPDPGANYWLAEKEKAPVDIAGRVIHDDQITRYLNDMATRLTAKLPGTAPRPRIHVYGSPSYEAQAMPTNDIFVSISVLAQAQSEDEIAALLGHEIAHVVLAHSDKDKLFESQRDLTGAAVEGVATVGYLAAAGESGTLFKGGTISQGAQRTLQEDTAAMAGAKMLIDFVGNDIVGSAWNRNQELDADLFGLDLMTDAGYNPNEFEYGISHIAEGRDKVKSRLSSLEALAAERTRTLDTTIASAMSQGDFGTGINAVMGEGITLGFQAGQAAVGDLRAYFADKYTDPEVRLDQGFDYIERFYEDGPLPDPRVDEWKSRRIALRIDAINNAYVEVSYGMTDLASKEFDDALAHVRQAYAIAPIGGDPFPRLVEAEARSATGDHAGALSALRSVSPSYPMSIRGYVTYSMLEANHGSVSNAVAVLDRAQSFYGNEAVQDTRIVTLAKGGRVDEARKAFEDCSNLTTKTQRRCRRAAEVAGLVEPAPERSGGFLGGLLGSVTGEGASGQQTATAPAAPTGLLGTLLGADASTAAPEATPAAAPATGGSPFEGLGDTLRSMGGALF